MQFIREHTHLKRDPIMFHGEQSKRSAAISAFMLEINLETGRLKSEHQPDTLIGLAGIMAVNGIFISL